MKIVVFSDAHVHKFTPFATVIDGMHSRVYWCLKAINDVMQYAKNNNIKDVFFLGDMFENKSYLDTGVLDLVYQLFKGWSEEGLKVNFISGNHDMSDKGKYTALRPLDIIGNVIYSTSTLTLSDGTKVVMIPFMFNKEEFVEQVKANPGHILMAHEGVDGAIIQGRVILNQGIPEKDILRGKHNLILLGHYHDPLCYPNPNIKSVGALLSKDFGDTGERGFLVVETSTCTWEFVPIDAPRFIKITSDLVSVFNEQELVELCKSNYVVFKVPEDTPIVEQVQRKCKDEAIKVLIDTNSNEKEYLTRLDISGFDDDKTIIEKYIEKYAEDLDKQRLKILGLELLQKCKR
jgi:DNA repair exonuclease SbcCD nuclease subunit